jgi:Asp/Glu/Hydantoin racemase
VSNIQLLTQTPCVIGIIMLDTQFPRPLGDVGHPDTFGVPTHLDRFKGVYPAKVVITAAGLRSQRLSNGFQSIVRGLQMRGLKAITTSCGFLVLLQKDLQAVAKIPVVTSSLLQLPALLAKERQVGVLTISASSLSAEHLRAAGVPKDRLKDVIMQGVPAGTEFVNKILGNQPTLDLAQAEKDVVAAALALKERAPHLTTLVLECTNMPPYKAALEAATGWQVRSLIDDPRLRKVIDATLAVNPTAPEAQNTPSSGESP